MIKYSNLFIIVFGGLILTNKQTVMLNASEATHGYLFNCLIV